MRDKEGSSLSLVSAVNAGDLGSRKASSTDLKSLNGSGGAMVHNGSSNNLSGSWREISHFESVLVVRGGTRVALTFVCLGFIL